MKRSDLIWAICGIDEDLLRVTEEEPDMKKINTRPLRILLIAAIVSALLVGTAVAYTVKNWDDLFVRSFNMEESDKEFMNDSLQDVYAQVTQDGIDFTVTQIMGTEHCMIVEVEIKLPDDLELGTTTAEDLKAYFDEIGRNWGSMEDEGSVVWLLDKYFDYDVDRPDFPDAPMIGDITLSPVHMEKEELMERFDKSESSLKGDTSEFGWLFLFGGLLDDKVREELGDEYLMHGSSGTIKNSYDPETRTLTSLHYVYSNGIMSGMPYTLIVDHVYLENMKDTLTPRALADSDKENLLSSPVVIHFTADYESQFQIYDVFQSDGTLMGTLELSPVSANVDLMLPDVERYNYMRNGRQLCVYMTDGREIELKEHGGGYGNSVSVFYTSDKIIDLSKVEEVRLGDYVLTPQSGG